MNSSNSNAVVNDVMTYLTFLLGMMEARDWVKFREVVLSNPAAFKLISKSISDSADFHGMTLLHAVVRFDPPIELLDQMIALYPQALMGEDCLRRTPLHVAAGAGARFEVVKLLVTRYPQACDVQDEDGRTPLHFACDASCELFEDDQHRPREPPRLETIRVLLAGSLNSVILEDADEMCAVEYAIISDAPMDVIRILQRASQRVLKERKKAKNCSLQGSQPATSPGLRAR